MSTCIKWGFPEFPFWRKGMDKQTRIDCNGKNVTVTKTVKYPVKTELLAEDVQVLVWNGRRLRKVTGRLYSYRDDALVFTNGRKWWLYYGGTHLTGDFETKAECIGWYENGGR